MRDLLSALENRLDEPTAKGLASAVSRAVRDGVIGPGDRLPPIREPGPPGSPSPPPPSAPRGACSPAPARSAPPGAAARSSPTPPRPGQAATGRRSSTRRPSRSTSRPAYRTRSLLPSLSGALHALTTAGTPHSYLDDPVLPEPARGAAGVLALRPARAQRGRRRDGRPGLVLRSRIQYGDRVVVEHPGFPPLLDLLEALGADVVGVPLDRAGLLPAALAEALVNPVVAVVLQPRAQNPTGISMSAARARETRRAAPRP
ncbi:hypothetical protein [Nocardioides convexus]|uniref:hypothetical protein n=1 Tax=Nocardioides convexus TaxID=2712224 RepID=UPI0024186875|nr:hypothetical protein [Nocardioides convexus]